MREIRKLITEIEDYIKKIEIFIYKNDKIHYLYHKEFFESIKDILMDTSLGLANLNTDEKINNKIIQLQNIKEEIKKYLQKYNINYRPDNEYDELLSSLDKPSKLRMPNITNEDIDNLINKLDNTTKFEQQIKDLPSASISDIKNLSSIEKFNSNVRL